MRYVLLAVSALLLSVAIWQFIVWQEAPELPIQDEPASIPDEPVRIKVDLPPKEEEPKVDLPANPDLARLVNPDAKNRVTGDIDSRLPRIDSESEFAATVRLLRDTNDNDTARNEAINLLRRSDYPHLTQELVAVLNNVDEKPRFRAFCAQHLGVQWEDADKEERGRIESVLRHCLNDPDVPVRREALLALVRAGDAMAAKTARDWLHAETKDDVRDLAIHCAYDLGLRDEIPTIRQYLDAEDDVVRIAAIVVLSQWGDQESRPAIERAANSSSLRLQRAGKAALRRLDDAAAQ